MVIRGMSFHCILMSLGGFSQIAQLKKQLDTVRGHRQQYRDRRASVPIPVISLVPHLYHTPIIHLSEPFTWLLLSNMRFMIESI